MLDGIVGYLKDFFAWMWDWVIAWFHDAFATIAQYLSDLAAANGLEIDPAQLIERMNTFAALLNTVNYWLPIKAVFGIFAAEWAIRLSMRTVRWIIGFIPTIEG